MGKEKKEKRRSESFPEENGDRESKWDEQVSQTCAIAKPLASRKLAKKIYKVVKKAQGQKNLRRGLRDVQKYIRKGETGIVVIAGNVNPLEVICHMPIVCEEKEIPYCYTPSKEDLGAAVGGKRPTCMILVKSHEDYQELFDAVGSEIKNLPIPL